MKLTEPTTAAGYVHALCVRPAQGISPIGRVCPDDVRLLWPDPPRQPKHTATHRIHILYAADCCPFLLAWWVGSGRTTRPGMPTQTHNNPPHIYILYVADCCLFWLAWRVGSCDPTPHTKQNNNAPCTIWWVAVCFVWRGGLCEQTICPRAWPSSWPSALGMLQPSWSSSCSSSLPLAW